MKRLYNPLLVTLVFFCILALSFLRVKNTEKEKGAGSSVLNVFAAPSLFQQLDAPLHDFLFRVRNRLFAQPVSPAITLVGVDDATTRALGKYGTGDWLIRRPFIEQVESFRRFYHPAVLAYDIFFARTSSQGDHPISENTPRLSRLEAAIKSWMDLQQWIPNQELADMAQFTGEQGDLKLAFSFDRLDSYDQEKNKTNILLAYFINDAPNYRQKWSREAILGDDPDDLDEDSGLELPYLRDVRIPEKYVSGAKNYPYFRYAASLPTRDYLDYVRLAYINVPRDEDGIIRRIPLVFGFQYEFSLPDKAPEVRHLFVPSFALLSCLYYWGIDLRARNQNDTFADKGKKPVISIQFGSAITIRRPTGEIVRIPIDNLGRMQLDFVGQIQDFTTASFADVSRLTHLEKKADGSTEVRADARLMKALNRKLVMLGITATGTTDVGPCPINANTPFVHIHMTAASNILTQTFIRNLTPFDQVMVLLVLWLLLAIGAWFMRPLSFTYGMILLVFAYASVCFYSVCMHWALLPLVSPVLFISFSYLSVVLYHYFSEEREKKRIRSMFSTMVSSEVLTYMEEHPESFSLAGERRETTIFFSDVAGFTTISESLPPARLVELLNRYLSPMTDLVMQYRGYVDKYEGDAIMAVWGVPNPDPEHARLACWSALDQQAKLAELRPILKAEFDVDIFVRMGLNSGEVSAGNMGSKNRFSYTVMGDAVNQAARFEPANKDYGTSIMIGETTFKLAYEFIEARLLDLIIVKGKTIPIKIFELLAKKNELDEQLQKVVALYHVGLEDMWARRWDSAIDHFTQALEIRPEDTPSQTMLKRVRAYRENPPPDSWQGEYIRTTKD